MLVVETSSHVCRDCPFALQVWGQLGLRWNSELAGGEIGAWLSSLYCVYNQHGLLITITLWALWLWRNKLMHKVEDKQYINLVLACVEMKSFCWFSILLVFYLLVFSLYFVLKPVHPLLF